ncbi:MAG: YdeI/OmpD-associated family protein [Bacteroidetes bacterium]|nr:YdeI/OmpD-associated family protein [Bacteroidota bacterium]MBU2584481.1 YdeI/OmpD-associated family protein [Bacteroidota bacterium]
MKNKKAWENFNGFANSYQNIYIGWITNAKREETRKKRIKEVVRRSASNQKPGMM